MKQQLKEIWRKIKSRIPVSRGRYERELQLLRLSVNRSIEQEKQELESLIQRFHYVMIYPSQNGNRELMSRLIVSDDLIYACRSPHYKNRLIYELAERTARELAKHF